MPRENQAPWTRAESETIIRRRGDEQEWDCFSSIRRDMTRLRRAAEALGREVYHPDEWSLRVKLPLANIQIAQRSPRIQPGGNPDALRRYRDEQRQSASSSGEGDDGPGG